MYDGRRVDRCLAFFGIEARIPLLDPELVLEYWKIPSEWRMPTYKNMEKYFIRKAFEDILPPEITWRRKEAFSDGISATTKSWYQIIQEHTKTKFNLDEKDFYKLNL